MVPSSHHWHTSGSMERWRQAPRKGIYTRERRGSSRRLIPQQKAACAHVLLMSQEGHSWFFQTTWDHRRCHKESPITAHAVGWTLCSSPSESKASTGASRIPATEQLLLPGTLCWVGAVYKPDTASGAAPAPAIKEGTSLAACTWGRAAGGLSQLPISELQRDGWKAGSACVPRQG